MSKLSINTIGYMGEELKPYPISISSHEINSLLTISTNKISLSLKIEDLVDAIEQILEFPAICDKAMEIAEKEIKQQQASHE